MKTRTGGKHTIKIYTFSSDNFVGRNYKLWKQFMPKFELIQGWKLYRQLLSKNYGTVVIFTTFTIKI